MHRKICIGMVLGTFIVVMAPIPSAFAATLKVRVDSIQSGKMIPTKYSFCMPAAQGHIGPGPDISPSISWTKGPRGTQSYVVFLTDTDSPKEQREKMNKEGMTVPSETKIGVPGLNTFTVIFAANDAMKGKYYGYDGPCPAWNDEIDPHHLHFMVYALSVKSLNMPQDFDGPAVIDAMKGKVLAEGKLDALYTTNPVTAAKVPK